MLTENPTITYLRRSEPNLIDGPPEKDLGIYVKLKLSAESKVKLYDWCLENYIPGTLNPDKFHVTLIWSPKTINYEGIELPITINPDTYKFDILGGALVLRFSNTPLQEKWKQAKEEGANFTFPTFLPHITLTYDPLYFDWEGLKPPDFPIILNREVIETLEECINRIQSEHK